MWFPSTRQLYASGAGTLPTVPPAPRCPETSGRELLRKPTSSCDSVRLQRQLTEVQALVREPSSPRARGASTAGQRLESSAALGSSGACGSEQQRFLLSSGERREAPTRCRAAGSLHTKPRRVRDSGGGRCPRLLPACNELPGQGTA